MERASEISGHSFTTADAGNISAGLTTGSVVMSFLEKNASAISAMVMIATCLSTILFYALNYFATKRGQKIKKMEIEREIIAELLSRATTEEKRIIIRLLGDDL